MLVDFLPPWCSPCRIIRPVLQEFAERNDRVAVTKINVDEAPALATQFGVHAIPSLVLLKDGRELDRFVRLQSANSLTQAIGRHVVGIKKTT